MADVQVHKTVWRLRSAGARCVALQFPEGLLLYACTLVDIFETRVQTTPTLRVFTRKRRFAGVEQCVVLGDVAYGACCIDDLSARALGASFLVHYGHSCLVPVDVTTIPCLYVFVDIRFDLSHLLACVRANFAAGTRLSLAGTIQFGSAVNASRTALAADYPALSVPQCKPLSPGEVLGCTAPSVGGAEAILFVADGRFHLEALMIANPSVPAYRYDPYARLLTRETYDHDNMRAARRAAIAAAAKATFVGLILGTLGRQGSPAILDRLRARLKSRNIPFVVVLLSEVQPKKVAALVGPHAWVQIACPRLSIDWGDTFNVPVLTPYEADIAFGGLPGWWEDNSPYAMTYYAKNQ